jgi:hypothetical protein
MGTGTIELTHRVGRLIETRIRGVLALEDVPFVMSKAQAIYASPIEKFLSVVDLRDAQLHGDEVAQPLLQLIKDANPRIERVGLLVGGDSLLAVQVEAIILSARHPARRVFRDAQALIEYLAAVATPAERGRIIAFLAEASPAL